jgi:hypothetical protein
MGWANAPQECTAMLQDKRKHVRQPRNQTAKFQTGAGSPWRDCRVTEVSSEGVRLHTSSGQVPDRFTLLLADEGAEQRKCKVIWRSGDEVGAEFMS